MASPYMALAQKILSSITNWKGCVAGIVMTSFLQMEYRLNGKIYENF